MLEKRPAYHGWYVPATAVQLTTLQFTTLLSEGISAGLKRFDFGAYQANRSEMILASPAATEKGTKIDAPGDESSWRGTRE